VKPFGFSCIYVENIVCQHPWTAPQILFCRCWFMNSCQMALYVIIFLVSNWRDPLSGIWTFSLSYANQNTSYFTSFANHSQVQETSKFWFEVENRIGCCKRNFVSTYWSRSTYIPPWC
jgi:hypothetical protein